MIRRALLRRTPLGAVVSRIVGMLLVASLLAGCDKCGNRVKFHAPILPGSCGENANPER